MKRKNTLKELSLKEVLLEKKPLSQEFHDKTKISVLSDQLDPTTWPEEWKKVFYKSYPRLEEVILPKPTLPKKDLKTTLVDRVSYRYFRKKKTNLAKISSLLYYAAGVRSLEHKNQVAEAMPDSRFYPSPGGRYPLEIYVLSLNSDLPYGIYHYYVKRHSLEKIYDTPKINLDSFVNQKWIKSASLLIFVSAVHVRNTVKYSDRGYRHILTEYGLLLQNFYLVSTALNIGCCAVGGFVDDNINNLLDFDEMSESLIGLLAVGEK